MPGIYLCVLNMYFEVRTGFLWLREMHQGAENLEAGSLDSWSHDWVEMVVGLENEEEELGLSTLRKLMCYVNHLDDFKCAGPCIFQIQFLLILNRSSQLLLLLIKDHVVMATDWSIVDIVRLFLEKELVWWEFLTIVILQIETNCLNKDMF